MSEYAIHAGYARAVTAELRNFPHWESLGTEARFVRCLEVSTWLNVRERLYGVLIVVAISRHENEVRPSCIRRTITACMDEVMLWPSPEELQHTMVERATRELLSYFEMMDAREFAELLTWDLSAVSIRRSGPIQFCVRETAVKREAGMRRLRAKRKPHVPRQDLLYRRLRSRR
jgi:hypothetical protein